MKKKSLIMIFMLVILFVFNSNIFTWEKPVTIISSDHFTYSYVSARIERETGHVYVVYKRRDSINKISNIYCRKFDGKKVTSVGKDDGNVSQVNNMETYFPSVQIKKGIVHVAWAEHPGNHDETKIKYKYFDGEKWSAKYDLGSQKLNGEVEDLHIDVDDDGNVFVVYMDWGPTICKLAYKVGNKIGQSNFPMGGRQKHADLGIHGDTIYFDYQWKDQGMNKYYLGVAKMKTTNPGKWYDVEYTIKENHNVGRPRISIDDDGHPNYFYYDDIGASRITYWIKWDGSKYTKGYKLLDNAMAYHFADLVARGDSVFFAVQYGSTNGGRGISYNWKKNNGKWTGKGYLPYTSSPKRLAVDLSNDGNAAVVVYEASDDSIELIASGEIKGGGSFAVDFTTDLNPIFYNTPVTFTASIPEPPDSEIKSYTWDFGDGNISEPSNEPTITHTYNLHRQDVKIKLTIITEDDQTGIIEKTFNIKAPYNAILDSKEVINIKTLIYNRTGYKLKWSFNTENETAGYQINKYQIWRALQVGTNPPDNEDDYKMVGEIDSSTLEFVDYTSGLDAKYNYYYIIRSIDSNGHISPLFEN